MLYKTIKAVLSMLTTT